MKIATAKKSAFSSDIRKWKGLKMYYRNIRDKGKPPYFNLLVWFNIQSTLKKVIPSAAENRQVIRGWIVAQGANKRH